MTDQDRASQIVEDWLDEMTIDVTFSPAAKRLLVSQIVQALSEARGDAREAPQITGDIAKPCNCTVHLHCPRCKGADGVTELGADRLTCLDCGHEWPPSALDPIPGAKER